MKRIFVFTLLVTLTSCLPATEPGNRYNPIDYSDSKFIYVEAGSTLYLRDDYSEESLNISDADMAESGPIFDDRTRKDDILTSRVNWLNLQESNMPTGWQAKITQQEIAYEVVYRQKARGVWSTRYTDAVRVTYALMIPEDARGSNRIRFTLYSKPGRQATTATYVINIRQPRTEVSESELSNAPQL